MRTGKCPPEALAGAPRIQEHAEDTGASLSALLVSLGGRPARIPFTEVASTGSPGILAFVYIYADCRAAEPHDADADAAVHPADECVLEVTTEPQGCASLALCPLQFREDSW